MNPNLNAAAIQFLANEFHLQPKDILPDTDFYTDLNLTKMQLADLIERMQDALNFTLTEERVEEIFTVGDLLNSLSPELNDSETD